MYIHTRTYTCITIHIFEYTLHTYITYIILHLHSLLQKVRISVVFTGADLPSPVLFLPRRNDFGKTLLLPGVYNLKLQNYNITLQTK